jgi:DNA-binding NarL/FixJ family response regulator
MTRDETGDARRGAVLIVDDHVLFRSGLRLLLERLGFEVADADGGEAALRRLRSFPADVVLMDVDMPDMSGIAATRAVLAHDPRTVVVMLSGGSEDALAMEALVAGASGYLLKDAQMRDIVAGIEAALVGGSPIAPRIAAALVRRLRSTTRSQPPGPAPVLSERERQVLALLAEGCDNAEIAQRLYVSPSTIKNHVSRVMEKLSVRNRVQAAVYAAKEGLVDGDRRSST